MRGCRALLDTEIDSLSRELSLRDRTILLLGIRTGYRIAELLSLSIGDVLDERGNVRNVVHVKRCNVKGKTAGQTVPIHEEARMQIAEYLRVFPGEANEPLFRSVHGRVDASVFRKALKKACIRALVDGKHVSSHSLRKSFAEKIWKASGENLLVTQKALRHKNPSSTCAYIDIDEDKISNLIKGVK